MPRATQSKGLLGFIVLNIANPFWTEVAHGAEEAAVRAGYTLVLCNSLDSAHREVEHLTTLGRQGAKGVLINSVVSDSSYLSRYRQRGLRIVLVDRASRSLDLCNVTVDDVHGAETAVRHYLKRGHQRLIFVNGSLAIRQYADRRKGVIWAMRAAGLNPDEAIISISRPVLDVKSGEDCVQEAVDSLKQATAIFCANDVSALGLLQGLRRRGISVPEDAQIIGYDDVEFARATNPPLTTVRQPKYDMGRIAAELLIDEIENPTHQHQAKVLDPELIVRDSAG